MLAVRLDEETENRLNNLSAQTHRSKSFYVKQALLEYLDDIEDIYIAEKRLEDLHTGKSQLVSFEDVKKDLGL
jgi:RHH-type rel operon transcriptional repressor/antitoxin RelB